jgi:dCMP deaminase
MGVKIMEPDINERHRHFLALAYEYAKANSSDQRTQNGAVIVDSATQEVISMGANRFPVGVKPLPERLQPEHKKSYLEHAERDAIFSALRLGKNTIGATMYVPWFACSDCAKAIIGAGITTVVGHLAACSVKTPWQDTIDIGLTLLQEANIKYIYYDKNVGVSALRFSGELVDR